MIQAGIIGDRETDTVGKNDIWEKKESGKQG